MASTLLVRNATEADAEPIALLLDQLGYPSTPGEVAVRLTRLRDFHAATIRVAESGGRVIGVVTSHVFPSIHTPSPVAWLTTLVVDETATGNGVGRALVASAERWAQDHGASRMAVTSGNHRAGAHAFYEHMGY